MEEDKTNETETKEKTQPSAPPKSQSFLGRSETESGDEKDELEEEFDDLDDDDSSFE